MVKWQAGCHQCHWLKPSCSLSVCLLLQHAILSLSTNQSVSQSPAIVINRLIRHCALLGQSCSGESVAAFYMQQSSITVLLCSTSAKSFHSCCQANQGTGAGSWLTDATCMSMTCSSLPMAMHISYAVTHCCAQNPLVMLRCTLQYKKQAINP